MKELHGGLVRISRGDVLYHEGDDLTYFYTAKVGQGARFKHLPNGDRQLVSFIFPGDIVGLQAVLESGATTTVSAASDMVLCRFHKSKLKDLFRESPNRAYSLVWIAAVEESFLAETIATLGQRSAIERMAWAFLQIHERLTAVGLKQGDSVIFPFTQRDMADALGLSLVHTNKTLARLRSCMRWENGLITLTDKIALSEIAMTTPEEPKNRPLL